MHKRDDLKGPLVPRNSKVERYFTKHSFRPDEIKLEPLHLKNHWSGEQKKQKFPIPVKH